MMKLMAMGFKSRLLQDSGNGYHLLFKIHAATAERQTIADLLSVLDMWFSTDAVKMIPLFPTQLVSPNCMEQWLAKEPIRLSVHNRVSRSSAFQSHRESSMELVHNVADIRRNMMSEMKKHKNITVAGV